MDCPICGKEYLASEIESHVNKCLFLNEDDGVKSTSRITKSSSGLDADLDHNKRTATASTGGLMQLGKRKSSASMGKNKKPKYQQVRQLSNEQRNENDGMFTADSQLQQQNKIKSSSNDNRSSFDAKGHIPLAEKVRPIDLANYVGQKHVLGEKTVLLKLLEKREIPSMILWGPPGCGKTSLANVISNMCKETSGGRLRWVKLSAAMSGVNDVKEAVNQARNELKYGRRTVMFMDEIHRFNKLQQDIFLPHVEAGTITLVGATTENPCFSLNSALLSRCRVVVLEKLKTEDLVCIVRNAVKLANGIVHTSPPLNEAQRSDSTISETDSTGSDSSIPIFIIDQATVEWLAETCDGDARIALGGLELALKSIKQSEEELLRSGPSLITLNDVKDGLKKSHVLYDKKGDQHYDMISALHKSVRASDDNASLYWLARMLAGGEDPVYIARRLVRMASEDVGLADPTALGLAVSVMNACKMIGMPESDVFLAQCAVYLARAPKSRMMEDSLRAAQRLVANQKGQQPAVPVHLRGTGSSRLVELLGNGKGYNMMHKDESGLNYLPEGLEDVNFFDEDELNITG